MEKLYNYLKKIGVQESHKKARPEEEAEAVFYREKYGDADYFKNAPNYTFFGAVVCFDYSKTDADGAKNLRRLEEKIKAYCKKYGYLCNTTAHPWAVYFTIHNAEDIATADIYYSFRDACIKECNEEAHKLYEAGHPEEVNKAINEIMERYGNDYNNYLIGISA